MQPDKTINEGLTLEKNTNLVVSDGAKETELYIKMAIVIGKFLELPLTIKQISKETNISESVIRKEAALYLRMKMVIEDFLSSSLSMKKLGERHNLSPATVDRYLNDNKRVVGYFGEKVYLEIQERLNRPLTELERKERLADIVREYLKSNVTIEQLAELTGYSSSTIQRELNNEEAIKKILGKDVGEEAYLAIQAKLAEALRQAKIKGGQAFAQNNIPTREKSGRITGSRRK